jgi:hypothetical protein
LLNLLEDHRPEPLFAMAHGRPDCLLGQDHDQALLAPDAPVLARRSVFAVACHTAAKLGRDMAREGVTWWGYIIEVSAPDDRELLRPLFVDVFAHIRGAFAGAGSPAGRLAVLTRTKDLCDRAAETVDVLADGDPDLDVMDALRSVHGQRPVPQRNLLHGRGRAQRQLHGSRLPVAARAPASKRGARPD